MNFLYLIILLIVIFCSKTSYSQNKNNLKTEKIKINKTYKPSIKKSEIIYFEPKYNKPKTKKTNVNYEIHNLDITKDFKTTFDSKEVLFKKDSLNSNKMFLKVGYGIYNNIILNASYSSYNKINQGFEIFAKHRSSSGGIKKTLKNGYSKSSVIGNINSVFRDSRLDIAIGLKSETIRNYGTILKSTNLENIESPKNTYNQINSSVNFSNKNSVYNSISQILYNLKLNIDYLDTKTKDKNFQINPHLDLKLNNNKNVQFGIKNNLLFSSIKLDSINKPKSSYTNNFITYLEHHSRAFKYNLGIGFFLGTDYQENSENGFTIDSRIIFSPKKSNYSFELYVSRKNNITSLIKAFEDIKFLGWKKDNPFRKNIENIKENINLKSVINYKISPRFFYSLGMEYKIIDNNIFYLPVSKSIVLNQINIDNVSYTIGQDKLTILSPEVNLSLKNLIEGRLNIISSFKYNFMEVENFKKPYGIRESEGYINTIYNSKTKKLAFNVTLLYIGSRNQIDLSKNFIEKTTLKAYVQASLGIKYKLNENFNVFLDSYFRPSDPQKYRYYTEQQSYFMLGLSSSFF